jgi:hypothetical protein
MYARELLSLRLLTPDIIALLTAQHSIAEQCSSACVTRTNDRSYGRMWPEMMNSVKQGCEWTHSIVERSKLYIHSYKQIVPYKIQPTRI